MENNLNVLRQEIDDINLSILDLINKRTLLLQQIGKLKDEYSMEYFDTEREAKMLENIFNHNRGPLYNELVKDIFSSIFSTSLKYMGITKEKKLLISSKSQEKFKTIREIFDLPDDSPIIVAGPCAVENIEYLEKTARFLRDRNMKFIRAGAYKPRTSPYDFQGMREDGLKILHDVAREYQLYTITEVVDTRDVELVSKYVDVLQIGARNMQNFELLKEAGRSTRPVLLKRGISATIQELMFAAEYVVVNGNRNVILCERGIRTVETKTRNTLDISAVPIIKKETGLPIIVDLSHSLGRKDIVKSIAAAVLAAEADGIMVEVHPYPELALSDSKQQLNLEEFDELLSSINRNVSVLK